MNSGAICGTIRQRMFWVHSAGNDAIQLFEHQTICFTLDEECMGWYFSIIDAAAALTDSRRRIEEMAGPEQAIDLAGDVGMSRQTRAWA